MKRKFKFAFKFVFKFSVKLEKWSLHVTNLPRTGKKCTEVKKAREERAKLLFLLIDIMLLLKCLVMYHHLLSVIFYLQISQQGDVLNSSYENPSS